MSHKSKQSQQSCYDKHLNYFRNYLRLLEFKEQATSTALCSQTKLRLQKMSTLCFSLIT